MKKKVLIITGSIIVIIAAVVLFCNNFRTPSYYKTKLPFEKNDGKLMGIIQIGGSDIDYDYSVVDRYFQTQDFETIKFGGEEKYLIIPRNDTLQVYSLEFTEDGKIEEKYIKSMDEPFYITCNISDIISNSMIRITNKNGQYSYSPYISLKDGNLVVEDFVLHIE